MAAGELWEANSAKYEYTFTSDKGTARTWQIREDQYDAGLNGTTDLTGSLRSHCVTNWDMSGDDEYSPIQGSETTVSFFDISDAVLVDLFGAIDDLDTTYSLVVLEGASVVWQGYIDPRGSNRGIDGADEMSITATDGLGRLEDYDYINTTSGIIVKQRISIKDVFKTMLATIPWHMDFYLASDMRPKVDATQLIATDDPLANIYVDTYTFRIKGQEGEVDQPVKFMDILKACLVRFGMRIFQAGGAWHCVQVNHFNTSSYRRWQYDYLGAEQATALFNPQTTLTADNESVGRTEANVAALEPYSAAMSTYHHGINVILKNPEMDPPKGGFAASLGNWNNWGDQRRIMQGLPPINSINNFYNPVEYWATSASTAEVKRVGTGGQGSGSSAIRIIDSDNFAFYNKTDAQINTEIGTKKVTQTSDVTIPAGETLRFVAEAWAQASDAALIHPAATAITVQIKLDTSGTDYYASLDADGNNFSWVTDANTWMLFTDLFPNDWHSIKVDSDVTPAAGTIVLSLGGLLEAAPEVDGFELFTPPDLFDYVLWDNATVRLVTADGSTDAEATTTANFLDRTNPVIKHIATPMGDGPISITPGQLSNDALNADDTSDWKEVATVHDGTAGDTVDEVLTRMMLRSMNRVRKLKSCTYFDLSALVTPVDTLVEPSTDVYSAYSLQLDWQRDTNSGTWYESREDGFTDDLVEGIDSGPGSNLFANRGLSDRAAFLMTQLHNTFFTAGALALTRTTEEIPAGAGTADVDVEAMAEPLLKNNDLIVMIDSELNYYQLSMSATPNAGATNILFDDPDNPGSNFSFPAIVKPLATIFLIPEKLATIARLGEQGFAITATNLEIGQVDGAQAATGTSLTVKNWNANYAGLSFSPVVYLDDGTALALTASPDLPRPGDTTITFSSTTYDAADNEKIWASAQVGRGDFIVTADEASLAINSVQSSNLLVGTTNGAITTGAKTTFQADLLIDVDVGDKFVIVSDNATEWGELYDITAVDDQVIGTNVQIFCASFNPSNTIPTGSSMYMQSKHVTEGKLAVRADEISALITRTSEPLGTFTGDQTVTAAEQVTNGAFTTDVSWTKGTGWTIDTANSNVAEAAAGVGSALSQVEAGVTNTTKFAVSFEISGRTAGSVTLSLGGTPGTARSTDGKYNEIITAGATPPQISLAKDSSFDGNIDNLTVREVFVISALPAKWDLKAGDTAYHWDRSLRVLTEVQIATDADNGTAGVALSATDTVEDGDILYAGLVSGLNIEFGSIDVVNSYIQSSNYVAGSAGWHIDEDGSAEFANVTVRGSLQTGTIDGTLTMTSPGKIVFDSGALELTSTALTINTTDVVIDSDGIDLNSGDVVLDSNGISLIPGTGNANKVSWDSGGGVDMSIEVDLSDVMTIANWVDNADIFIQTTSSGGGSSDIYLNCNGTSDGDVFINPRGGGFLQVGGSSFTVSATGALKAPNVQITGDINHDGSQIGFFSTAPAAQPTSVAVTAAGIHAALVTLGLIT